MTETLPVLDPRTKPEFFEKQKSKDCSVHSLNNAFGRVVITPDEVTQELAKRVAAFAAVFKDGPKSKRAKDYSESLATHNTFFSAECVWYAATALGRCWIPKQLDHKSGITPDILAHDHLIILGVVEDGTHHAVGARFGKVYDSLNDDPEPEPLDDQTMKEIYKEILGIFGF